jgi:hypothetical protein
VPWENGDSAQEAARKDLGGGKKDASHPRIRESKERDREFRLPWSPLKKYAPGSFPHMGMELKVSAAENLRLHTPVDPGGKIQLEG